MWSKFVSNNVCRDFRLSFSAFSIVAWKSFISQNWFSNQAFYVTIIDANIGRLKSLHTLFDLEAFRLHAGEFNQNHMTFQNTQNFELFGKKMWESVDAVLEHVAVTKTIVWYKNITLKTIIFQCLEKLW